MLTAGIQIVLMYDFILCGGPRWTRVALLNLLPASRGGPDPNDGMLSPLEVIKCHIANCGGVTTSIAAGSMLCGACQMNHAVWPVYSGPWTITL